MTEEDRAIRDLAAEYMELGLNAAPEQDDGILPLDRARETIKDVLWMMVCRIERERADRGHG